LKRSKTLAEWSYRGINMEFGRLAALESKHKDLHSRIEALEAERAPDKYITPLKKEKLLVKDSIEKLRLLDE